MRYHAAHHAVKPRGKLKCDAERNPSGTMVLLAAIKLFAGIISGAISITADAVNNLSAAGAHVVSFISFKISGKPADRDHPFGHARIEYVASMIVSFFVLLVGFELFRESFGKIFAPQSHNY
ncbi:MAG: cation transporter, partial [Kiritimatiellae bacterium]|nr:cation transporter [Kiritimatiellia bacterium]